MKNKFLLSLVATVFSYGPSVFAQDSDVAPESGVSSQAIAGIRETSQPIFYTVALGPAFTTGLESDSMLYNLLAAMNYNYTENISGKIFGDLAMGGGNDSARFFNLGAGADYYPTRRRLAGAAPYVTGDAGVGFTRNDEDDTENAVALGVGGGLRFANKSRNWDVNIHYTALTSENEGSLPTVLALRGGMNF